MQTIYEFINPDVLDDLNYHGLTNDQVFNIVASQWSNDKDDICFKLPPYTIYVPKNTIRVIPDLKPACWYPYPKYKPQYCGDFLVRNSLHRVELVYYNAYHDHFTYRNGEFFGQKLDNKNICWFSSLPIDIEE